jgi:hypothetical protein
MLIHDSRTRSPVGRTRPPSGAAMLRPRHLPEMIRTRYSALGRTPATRS